MCIELGGVMVAPVVKVQLNWVQVIVMVWAVRQSTSVPEMSWRPTLIVAVVEATALAQKLTEYLVLGVSG